MDKGHPGFQPDPDVYQNMSRVGPVTPCSGQLAPVQDPDEQDAYAIPDYMFVTVTLFSILIFLLGVVGNLMVMCIILRNRDMRSATNLCLLSLSVADLLVLLICMPSALLEFYGRDVWYLGHTMCKLVPFLENTAAHASASTILAISVERYFAICLPLRVRQICTYTGTARVVAAVWLMAALLTIPYTVMTFVETAKFFDGSDVQVCRTQIKLPWQQVYVILMMCLFFVVPFLILSVLYVLIGRRLVEQAVDPRFSRNSRTSISFRLRRQIVLMLGIVTALFFLCLLPFKVVSIWYIYVKSSELEKMGLEGYLNLISFSRTMYYINSAANPVVYNLVSTRFRNYFKRSMMCMHQAEDPRIRSLTVQFSARKSLMSTGMSFTCGDSLMEEPYLIGLSDFHRLGIHMNGIEDHHKGESV